MGKLYSPPFDSNGEDNGQVTIIGGSSLFHGAPILSLIAASKIVDMVFFASPEGSVGRIVEQMKSRLSSFIWVPWGEVENYIIKSDSVLIGPGLMRYSKIDGDETYKFTKNLTKKLLEKYPQKRWVIDAGSLQTMEVDWIPKNAILTPNKKEYEILFGDLPMKEAAKKYDCIIVRKGATTIVAGPSGKIEVNGGNPGLTKGGVGDVQAGVTVALLAKNEPFLAAEMGAKIVKKVADNLFKTRGVYYSSDDLASEIGIALHDFGQ